MLINCPECELQVSDKATNCPHCGYPLRPAAAYKKHKTGHMRLPNGFGQISEIKNRTLRNPWRAMVTVGFTSTGRPISKILKPQGYFPTYNEAYKALVEYNRNPYDLEDDIRLTDLFQKWSPEYFSTLKSDSSVRSIKSAWNYCSTLYDMRVKDIRARHIKEVMEHGEYNGKTPSAGSKERIKSMFNLMLDYAVEYEIVDRNYARTFDVSDEIVSEIEAAKRQHLSFTDDEMKTIWENINVPYVKVLIVQCYMGWRPQELGLIELVNCNFEEMSITGGMKTDAGRNRTVPIHSCIQNIILELRDEAVEMGSNFLINCSDTKTHSGSTKMTYDKWNYRFKNIISDLKLNPEHRPHDPRKQFVTMCKKYNVDEYAIKHMVGHEVSDITEAVYTDRPFSWYKSELEKIKGPV